MYTIYSVIHVPEEWGWKSIETQQWNWPVVTPVQFAIDKMVKRGVIKECPTCHSWNIRKDGKGRKNQQQYECAQCGRKFI